MYDEGIEILQLKKICLYGENEPLKYLLYKGIARISLICVFIYGGEAPYVVLARGFNGLSTVCYIVKGLFMDTCRF